MRGRPTGTISALSIYAELSAETPAPGLVLLQPKRGYRYGVEVYLLADFALHRPAQSVLDLGCGSGIVGLLLASQGLSVIGVEREASWIDLAQESIRRSQVGMTVVQADIREFQGEADLVVCNPPWFPAHFPLATDPVRAAARSMLHGDVADFVDAGLRMAPRVCIVTRPERLADLHRPNSFIARIAHHGERLLLAEICRGSGTTEAVSIDMEAAYARFRGLRAGTAVESQRLEPGPTAQDQGQGPHTDRL